VHECRLEEPGGDTYRYGSLLQNSDYEQTNTKKIAQKYEPLTAKKERKKENSNEPHLKIYNVMATWKSNKRQGTDVAGDFGEQDGGYLTPLSDIYIL
jgi:hypothetical protein